MRLLVVDSVIKERDATVRLLPTDAHEIEVAKDSAEALNALETRDFDVVLVEYALVGTSGLELVKRIRARESSTHVYIVVTAARVTAGDLKLAFLAGADDFIRKPVVRDELLARIEGPARIRRWTAKVFGGGALVDGTSRTKFTSMTAWTSADLTLCSELTDMLGFVLTPTAAQQALDGSVQVAALSLSLASEDAEVSLAVGVDEASALAFSQAMFGSADVGAAALTDMMCEFANVAAGAFKRMAATEGHVLTTGLPTATTAQAFRHATATARKQWIGTVEGSAINVRFELEVRARERKRLRVASLREGMVVASDLRNPLGALLVPSGTRITESHLGGLRRTLGDDVCVEVLEAA